jgi:Predicted transcriptional regulators
MISQEEDVEAHALRRQGWTVSAIARHLGRDRKTVRAYLNGDREPGVRKRPAAVDPFDGFEAYVRQRFIDDPHVWAVTLFDEVTAAGYSGAYPTFTRKLRERRLRPPCEASS